MPRGARGVQPDARVRPAHQPRQRGRGGLLQRLGGEHRAHQGPAQLPATGVQVHRRRGREVLYNADCRQTSSTINVNQSMNDILGAGCSF